MVYLWTMVTFTNKGTYFYSLFLRSSHFGSTTQIKAKNSLNQCNNCSQLFLLQDSKAPHKIMMFQDSEILHHVFRSINRIFICVYVKEILHQYDEITYLLPKLTKFNGQAMRSPIKKLMFCSHRRDSATRFPSLMW